MRERLIKSRNRHQHQVHLVATHFLRKASIYGCIQERIFQNRISPSICVLFSRASVVNVLPNIQNGQFRIQSHLPRLVPSSETCW
jgi:hypothetical protein